MRGPAWKLAGLALACFLAAVVVSYREPGRQLDARAYDTFLWLRQPAPQPTSAVVVAIDESTLHDYGGVAELRPTLVKLLQVIAPARAKAVVLDVQLSDPQRPERDDPLARALRSTPNLVLSSTMAEERAAGRVYWEDPLPKFSNNAALGHVHADPDEDGVSRHVLLAKAAAGQRRWALALEAFRLAAGVSHIVETEQSLEVGPISIPASYREQRLVRVRYLPKDAIGRISAKDLIEKPALASRLRDRVAFIGETDQGGPDRIMTPYSAKLGEKMPGVEVHAQLYETLARRDFLLSVPMDASLAIAFAFVLAMAVCFQALGGARAFAVAFGLLALAHALPFLFLTRNYVLPASLPMTSAWFCFLSLGTRQYLLTRKKLGITEAQRDRYQQAVHYVTHEMRTPLTAIQGSSELMGRYALNEEKRKEIAGLIHRESRRLARMIEMFLSVERLSAGQLELKRDPVSGAELLSICIERARPLADRKQIRIELAATAASEEAVLGDREFLEYAFYNLITNAIKYSPPDTVILAGVERSGDEVRISVEDQGYGMDEQEVKHIFQKFYRTRRAQESGEAGAGIGLSLVEEIVVAHGGAIEVRSRVNQGSRFTLVLPRAEIEVEKLRN